MTAFVDAPFGRPPPRAWEMSCVLWERALAESVVTCAVMAVAATARASRVNRFDIGRGGVGGVGVGSALAPTSFNRGVNPPSGRKSRRDHGAYARWAPG